MKQEGNRKQNIQDLQNSRSGGQIALRGYSFQLLYSCVLMLKETNPDNYFTLEGIEDIDHIIFQNESVEDYLHIQLKYSSKKQDASFLKPILENYLEAFLLDNNRSFKMVYDFPVAKGHLRKLMNAQLDAESSKYWESVIEGIKEDKNNWDWSDFKFEDFIRKLQFEKVDYKSLISEIESELISRFEITTDNLRIYVNSIEVFCLKKMKNRDTVHPSDIENLINEVIFDISKGYSNPAHGWIRKVEFSEEVADPIAFFEGKRTTPSDIVAKLPVDRLKLEKDIKKSVSENTITVIKASSGQGKTTLALKTILLLSDEYVPYQLTLCDDARILGNIIDYFKARIRLGEKVLILIDNLDKRFSVWNQLVRLLQDEIPIHYKIIITTRESDWFYYCGDLSNIKSMRVIKPILEEKEAADIYRNLNKIGRIHSDIKSWKWAWHKVADQQLLIEYIYLLTHGEMLSNRIEAQIKEISASNGGGIRCNILRRVCLADCCGIKVSLHKLLSNLNGDFSEDIEYVIKSLQNEYLVSIDGTGVIEGLHPVRSKHIVDSLHSVFPVDNTALAVLSLLEKDEVPVFFSQLYNFTFANAENFYDRAIDIMWDVNDLASCCFALKGVFTASVMGYYIEQKQYFDEGQRNKGLEILIFEKSPFQRSGKIDFKQDTIQLFLEINPESENIKRLAHIRDTMPEFEIASTNIYILACKLYTRFLQSPFAEIKDIESFSEILEWLLVINESLDLSRLVNLKELWEKREAISLTAFSSLMYVEYCCNEKAYQKFISENFENIVHYLKYKTKTQLIYIEEDNKAIHAEYASLELSGTSAVNNSVERLKYICKTLPIYEFYCSDLIKPHIELLEGYKIPDDAHKEMPIKNVVMTFNQGINSLWLKTLKSNYEFDTADDWMEYWQKRRKLLCRIEDKAVDCICRLLENRSLDSLGRSFDNLCIDYNEYCINEYSYPRENAPFSTPDSEQALSEKLDKQYFNSVDNFTTQFIYFLKRDEQTKGLAITNLRMAKKQLVDMQSFFEKMSIYYGGLDLHRELCAIENQSIDNLIIACEYYTTHFPSKGFKRLHITAWNKRKKDSDLKNARILLQNLSDHFDIVFPSRCYYDGVIKHFPVAIYGFEELTEDEHNLLIICLLDFADSDYSYLDIIPITETIRSVNNQMLCFSVNALQQFREIFDGDNENSDEQIQKPYWVDITDDAINSFEEKIKLRQLTSIPIDQIAEKLWIISKSRELLHSDHDARLLNSTVDEIKVSAYELLDEISENLSEEGMEILLSAANAVIDQEAPFTDAEYNNLIAYNWTDYFISDTT